MQSQHGYPYCIREQEAKLGFVRQEKLSVYCIGFVRRHIAAMCEL